jgi:3-hydroxyisobutyrate dehydrogenase
MPMSDAGVIAPGATVGFVGLGRMGSPMAGRLAAAGYRILGFDVSERARESWAGQLPDPAATVPAATVPAATVPAAAAAADGAEAVILMLPDSSVVTDVLLRHGLLAAAAAGAVVVDMSSSEPRVTRDLAATAASHGVTLVDAPVSGGVTGARQGSLTIMVGGPAAAAERVRPMLEVMGSRVLHVGDCGAGHAVKALNNLLSGTHLLVTSEAMAAAAEFGLDVPAVLDAINTSSGRSGSTENKWPNYIVPGTFDSGFPLRLLVKDMRIALGLEQSAGTPARLSAAATEIWAEAAAGLPAEADHTEIARWLRT